MAVAPSKLGTYIARFSALSDERLVSVLRLVRLVTVDATDDELAAILAAARAEHDALPAAQREFDSLHERVRVLLGPFLSPLGRKWAEPLRSLDLPDDPGPLPSLTYCTDCGHRVDPYEPNAGGDRCDPPEPNGGDGYASGDVTSEVVTYWCPSCARHLAATDVSSTGWMCRGCHHHVPSYLRFCGFCGQPNEPSQAGAPAEIPTEPWVERTLRFCTSCGHGVGPYEPDTTDDPPSGEDGRPEAAQAGYWCPSCARRHPAPRLGGSITMIWCGTCRQAIPLAVRFCGYCGHEQKREQQSQKSAASARESSAGSVPPTSRIEYECLGCRQRFETEITESRSGVEAEPDACRHCGQSVGTGPIRCRECGTCFEVAWPHWHDHCDMFGGRCPSCGETVESLCIC